MFAVPQKGVIPLQDVSIIDAICVRTLASGISARGSISHLNRFSVIELSGDIATSTSPARDDSDATHLGSGTRILECARHYLSHAGTPGACRSRAAALAHQNE